MPKKPDKIESKKIGSVSGSRPIEEAESVERVREVRGVSSAEGIGVVTRTDGAVRHEFSIEDKEKLFAVVEEEAKKLFGDSTLSPQKRELIEQAVKTAIESGLITKEQEKV